MAYNPKAPVGVIYDEEVKPKTGIKKAQEEEERLRQAALKRMDQRSAQLRQEGIELEKGFAAAAGRGAAAATGRRSGMASGGGKMAALSGIEMDLQERAAQARAGLAERQYDQDLGRLQFERETMKSSAQMKQEAGDHQAALKQMYDDSRTLGILDNAAFNNRVDAYIRRMGLSGEEAAKIKADQKTFEDNESFFY